MDAPRRYDLPVTGMSCAGLRRAPREGAQPPARRVGPGSNFATGKARPAPPRGGGRPTTCWRRSAKRPVRRGTQVLELGHRRHELRSLRGAHREGRQPAARCRGQRQFCRRDGAGALHAGLADPAAIVAAIARLASPRRPSPGATARPSGPARTPSSAPSCACSGSPRCSACPSWPRWRACWGRVGAADHHDEMAAALVAVPAGDAGAVLDRAALLLGRGRRCSAAAPTWTCWWPWAPAWRISSACSWCSPGATTCTCILSVGQHRHPGAARQAARGAGRARTRRPSRRCCACSRRRPGSSATASWSSQAGGPGGGRA